MVPERNYVGNFEKLPYLELAARAHQDPHGLSNTLKLAMPGP